MTAFANHMRLDFLAGIRNSTTVLMFYLFPLGFYVLMSLVMTEINPMFEETAVPAMVVVTLVAGTILGLPGTYVEARQLGVYRTFKVNGVPAWSILGSPAISSVGHALLASMIVAVTAGPVFDLPTPTNWGVFVLVTAVTAGAFGALGALIGVVSDTGRGTVLWSQLVFLPAMLIGGLMMDLSLLPDTVLPFSKLLPPTYAGQALMGLGFGVETTIDAGGALAVLVASLVVSSVLATLVFSWDPANRSRRAPRALALVAVVPFAVGALLL